MFPRMMLALAILASLATAAVAADDLQKNFTTPPDSARPWVYWFWLNQNITKEGITADLEAMRRVGIGGVLIMEVDQGTPAGPVAFAGPKWRELFKHVCAESARLGLEVNMNNDAGWCGSGGPWITPEVAQQKLVWSETKVEGPKRFDAPLAESQKIAGYYRDVAVLAFPTPKGKYEIKDFRGKSAQGRQEFPPPPAVVESVPAEQTIARAKIVDLTGQVKDGRLAWDVPAGSWTIVRFGHTPTGKDNHPAPVTGRGLECDKLSTAGADAMFAGLMAKLAADNGPLVGKTLVSTHIDSWEVGSPNWTRNFREEFQKRRGYDPLLLLPAMTGRVVDSLDVSERFLWDVRQTVSDLLLDNYAGRFRELARKHGMRLSIEAYGDGTFDDMTYAGHCDEPMAEFWAWGFSTPFSCTEMSSAAHVYGKRILGAEAFTSTDAEKWLSHPATIKTLGDWAFCEGINRFVFHRYAMQPWLDRKPGMSMGPWGLHYERTQTWWEQSRPWHEYLTRCQYLLQRGLFVADILYLQPEGAPRQFKPPVPYEGNTPERPGYNYDGCTPEVILTRLTVKDGRLVLPDGMSYRVLVLPDAQTMTPPLLAKIAELVEAGATVVGPRPVRSPSLAGYPACDDEVKKLAERLWGDCDGKKVTEHKLGKGRIVWGKKPEEALSDKYLAPDFTCGATPSRSPFRYIHRRTEDGTDLYFVSNKTEKAQEAACLFRVEGKRPELWWPETGRTEPAPACRKWCGGRTRVVLRLEPAESVFVAFRRPWAAGDDPVWHVSRDGKQILAQTPKAAKIVIEKASYGVPGDAAKTRDVKARLQELVEEGQRQIPVVKMAEGGDPAFGVVKTLTVRYLADGKPQTATARDGETMKFDAVKDAERIVLLRQTDGGRLVMEAWKSGRYELTTAEGKKLTANVSTVPAPLEIGGSWDVAFPPKAGAPEKVTLPKLVSWSDHAEAGVKYFSGTATYRKTFDVPQELTGKDRVLYLDLGRVEIMAEMKLNGKDLGLLWKPPYRVDITQAVKPGGNTLEIKLTNLWINRMIGDQQLPEDSDRNPDGTLKAWPKWLQEDKPNPAGRFTFTSWRLWKKDSPLQPSGLIGPVTVQAAEVKRIGE